MMRSDFHPLAKQELKDALSMKWSLDLGKLIDFKVLIKLVCNLHG
jgi:hypothetical protein